MRRLLSYILFFFVLFPTVSAQIPEGLLRSCPTVYQVNYGAQRILCTSGTAAEPDRDTGIAPSLHQFITNTTIPSIRLGSASITDTMPSASISYFYRVDTTRSHLFCTSFSGQIAYSPNAVGPKPEFSIRILDSNGTSIDTNCLEAVYSGDNATLWHQYNGYDTLVHLYITNEYLSFDLRSLHGRVVRIQFNTTCRSAYRSSCTASFTLDCYNILDIYNSDLCGQTITYYAPPGFRYRWTLASDTSTVLGTESSLHDRYNQYITPLRCQLSFKSPTSQNTCFIENLYYTPPTSRYVSEGSNLQDAAFYWDTVGYITSGTCAAQMHLRDSTTIRVVVPFGSYSVHDSSIFTTQYRIVGLCDTLIVPCTTTLFNLKPGGYRIYRDIITPTCTFTYSNYFTVYPFPCAYYDTLIRTCPDEIDTCSIRYLCDMGYVRNGLPTYDSLGHLIGHIPPNYYYPAYFYPWDHMSDILLHHHHHHPIHSPGTDPITQNQLTTTPSGFPTSFLIGNETSDDPESTSQNLYFQYHVDTTQHSILMLRYALVMQYLIEEPYDSYLYAYRWCWGCHTHEDTIQQITLQHTNHPRFLFHLLDSTGHEIRPDLYNIDITLDTIPNWNTGTDSSIFWKDWHAFAIDLHALHGRTITIHFATETSHLRYSRALNYAYIHLQCIESIRDIHCQDTHYYNAPDGFTYQWFPDGHPDSIISTSQQFLTTSDNPFYCLLTDISDTTVHILFPTILTKPKYPVAQFSLDTVEILDDCSLLLHINNGSHIATEHGPDSITTTPCNTFHYWVDDTLTTQDDTISHNLKNTFKVPIGEHTLTFVAYIDGTSCTDTLVYTFLVTDFCHCYDTVYDTIVQNQLPHFWHGIPFNDSAFYDSVGTPTSSADTSLFIPGIRPQCDSLIDYHLRLYRNTSDSAIYVLCPDDIPFPINDTISIANDTTVIFSGMHGEDSTVYYTIIRLSNTDTTIYDTILEDQLPWLAFDTLFNDVVANYIYHTYNEAGCDSLIRYNLYIFWNGDHCDTALSYPNVVTPNGDGVNDRFVIGGLIEHNCFKYNELIIYDRYGHCVYHKRNIATDTDWWDPAAQRAPSGTYFYYFKAHGVNIWTQHRGVIEVLKE
ncbi:MAG: gliding motility-associated C-terminal domain-containing protein [Bacteroidales bacterium]|nr:gliding motility-associated C-terminal domain-containing protein [Bacteroidales bacterium]